eukprot:gnl/MRDRNA2_/MRDRNA2_109022_c0_seq1.p1 gnl/MRDRNA2_/MRDRNA2_109022_c0~~gnl/MRDRNA2_/MRDRNA2_109022_c0_seq1.p1  ORF type:complete len:579 (-),score=126.30 gnl/MRDRNA2_/MRDRNA2_109022_c0_seq1:187-1923(-)
MSHAHVFSYTQTLKKLEHFVSDAEGPQVGKIVKEDTKPAKIHGVIGAAVPGARDAHRGSKVHASDRPSIVDFAPHLPSRKVKAKAHSPLVNIFKSYAEAEERKARTGESTSSKNIRITSADLKRRAQFLGRRAQMARLQTQVQHSWSSPDMHEHHSRSKGRQKSSKHHTASENWQKARQFAWVVGEVRAHGAVLHDVKSLNKMLQKAEEEQKQAEKPQVRPTMVDVMTKTYDSSLAQHEFFGALDDDDDEDEGEDNSIEPTDAALAQFAEFVIQLADGTLRGAFTAMDPKGTGRVKAWEFTEFLNISGFMGDPEVLFRALDQDSKGWIGLRDFRHLGPFMVLVQQHATQRRNSIEKKAKELSKGFEHLVASPLQTELSAESKHAVPQQVVSLGRSLIGPMKVKIFTNAIPHDIGVSLFLARTPRDMKHLFELCDRVCRPKVGKVRLLYDQSLRVIRDPASLEEGCAYLACGLEPLSPPALFLNGESIPDTMVPEFSRASTAPDSKSFDLNLQSHPSDSRASTAPLSKSRNSSWRMWHQIDVGGPLCEPRRSSRPLIDRGRPVGGPESWGFAEAAPCLL